MNILWFLRSSSNNRLRSDLDSSSPQWMGLRWTVWIIAAVLGLFLLWAHWAVIDQITRAPGVVIASSKTQVIQSMDGGTIDTLLVKEGDVVEADQLLLRFDKTRVQAAYMESQAKLMGLTATVARLQSEVLGTPLVFPPNVMQYPQFVQAQTQLHTKRQALIRDEVQSLQGLVVLAEKELAFTAPLLQSGDVSLTEVIRLQRQVAELKAQINNKNNRYFQDAQAELSKAQEDLAMVQQNLAQRKNQLDLTELRAPVRGVVKNVRITTQGGVVRAGEEVMQIVPLQDDLVIQAKVSSSDIAFLKIGRPATIKFDAYDYTIYGDLQGKLTYISPDTLTEDLKQGELPYYRAMILTDGRRFSSRPHEQLDIQPGMTATVEIKMGQRSVLSYLLKPITKTMSESLGER